MAGDFIYDVFLSHNSRDKARVRKLAERLRDAGVRVWFDEWVIAPGDDIYLAIERGLEAARVQVLCLSPEALASDWVTLERNTVLFRDPTNAGRRFIPLLLADCELPDTLRRYKYVDFREETQAAFDELVVACAAAEAAQPVSLRPTRPAIDPDFRLRHRFRTGGSYVHRIAWSPSGHQVAAACDDGAARIWDTHSGRQQFELAGSLNQVFAVAFSPTGERLASAGAGGEILVWKLATGEILNRLAGHSQDIWDLAFSPDGTLLASASDDGTVGIWNIVTSRNEAFLQSGGLVEMWGLRFSRSGKILISGSTDGTVHAWDVAQRKAIRKLRGHRSPVFSVAFSPDDTLFASCSVDKTVRIWSTDSLEPVATLEGHQSSIEGVDFSYDGTLLATKSLDGTVMLWRSSDWTVAGMLSVPIDRQWHPGLAFHPSENILATLGARDREVHLWDIGRVGPLRAAETGFKNYASAKVVLLGEGAVGKTSLAHRLIEDRYVVSDRTHGMNVWRLELPLANPQKVDRPLTTALAFGGGEGAKTDEREALLWDLAGQEDHRLIHRLFLEETALALLLINPQKDDPFAEAGDWLKSLDTAAGNQESKRDAARLLIFSQIDVGGMKLGNAKIERFRDEHGFAGWMETSAKTGENCSDEENGGQPSKLKQLIADSIPWDKLPWTATPRMLAELKNAVMKMRDSTDIRLLRFAELAQRLEQALPDEHFAESDVRTAVTLLANHGLARPLKFGDLVLLQPELLNGYAGAIIRAARAHKDEIGSVLEENIYGRDFDFTGVDRLTHRPDEELLLRAMVQTFLDHSLCIAEETTHGRQLVFPSQYRREKDIPHEPDVFVSYTFDGEWQTVWTTLVVRLWYSQEFEHRELWRNAAEFASNKGHTLGLKIDNRQGEGQATISLYFDVKVPDELKVIFIEYVHRHLDRYACDVTRDRRYVCGKCGRPFKDLALIRELLDEGQPTVICQKCRTEVELIDFIEQRLKSDPVARKILAMEETATRELDTQALEQILIGHVQAISGEANQIFRELTKFDYGIDGEVEFKDNDGKASGKKIYVQLKSGNSYLRQRKSDGSEVFDVKDARHLDYWVSQPVDVYLVIRQTDERSGKETIRWMNVTRYLRDRKDQKSRQIVFDGEALDIQAVWKARDFFFPHVRDRNPKQRRSK